MTLNEFKAWLEGYSASFEDGAPNADQWAKIAEKLDTVEHVVRYEPKLTNQCTMPKVEVVPLDLRGIPMCADPEVSPLLKPQVTC
ncbi:MULTISPECIES: hypothetical protein [unclassified Brucella]|uniref:hypothetical protein n=1 Tax=unclassified Brucella TaxID=2632610 RepID=UPI000972C7B6|nr:MULTISPECIES: hypothetical protein [unclassified Brucella]APX70742.1 hypothetical protein BKD03_16620 [Brucella sp. 09RB8471]MRN44952.1 hypothetical protein [Brucella sp. 09RB8913]MRN60266.1 hypothetical protein [Brucella sp. 09RB8918]MRN76823.1 hypothetical protein [Brucella sp. 10RB9210]CAB4327640.1 hypothetical protein BCH_03062 [Brucella sp. 191011898]